MKIYIVIIVIQAKYFISLKKICEQVMCFTNGYKAQNIIYICSCQLR